MIRLHNTLTRTTDEFRPITPGEVRFYTCGLTVYNQPHIGNWLGYIYWDILVRLMEAQGYTVHRVQNITDVGHLTDDGDNGEDKMQKGARREGVTAWDVARKYSDIAEHEAYDLLQLRRPTALVAATSCIDKQLEFAEGLDKKGYLYKIEGDGMYFDTSKLADYGKLARLDVEGLQAGARVSVVGKRQPTDFAVWKFSPINEQRDMEWDSPWGKGFPGWHLECSVIARENLGDTIDIHAGGIDHIPVHHTNEIAQTESLTGKPFAHYWIHNNHMMIEGEKIAKSAGNGFTLEDLAKRGFSPMDYKFLTFSRHYRTQGNFTWEALAAAKIRYDQWRAAAVRRYQTTDDASALTIIPNVKDKIISVLEDDLDTAQALIEVGEVMDTILDTGLATDDTAVFAEWLQFIDQLFGFNLSLEPDVDDTAKTLLKQRGEARSNKDYATSDRLRDELAQKGIAVNDTAQGQFWHYADATA